MNRRLTTLIKFIVLKPRVLFSVLAIRKIRGYTMQTIPRVFQMEDHIGYLNENNIEGAIVETGCWKGGLGAYMARFNRTVWLFDSFEGLPEMTKDDVEIVEQKNLEYNKITGYIAVDEQHARDIAQKLNVEPNIVKGWFSDSLPKHKDEIGKIAILRLDGDTYSSTLEALDILYENVAIGGLVVVDDYYDFSGCRKALYDFFVQQEISPEIREYPFGRAYFVKEEE
jgi:O-methyltransferase